jgi:hypothetical protein
MFDENRALRQAIETFLQSTKKHLHAYTCIEDAKSLRLACKEIVEAIALLSATNESEKNK